VPHDTGSFYFGLSGLFSPVLLGCAVVFQLGGGAFFRAAASSGLEIPTNLKILPSRRTTGLTCSSSM
jgi:hypothetical protein